MWLCSNRATAPSAPGKALLLEQRDQLEERIATMQQTLERLNHKIENYGNCLAKEPELRGKAKD